MVLGRGLGRGKGVLIDAGLHNMYVHTIRRAKHFIYIENQFFTGTDPDHYLKLLLFNCPMCSLYHVFTCRHAVSDFCCP